MTKKARPADGGTGFYFWLFGLVLRLDAAGAGFNPLAFVNCVLEVGKKAHDAGAHAVRTLDGAAVSLSANGAHSWHKFKFLKIIQNKIDFDRIP